MCCRLPGEALQIDRIMEAFAAAFCEQNPGIFDEQDTCFILAFSIIMLNTALHNPSANINISSEQFLNQNRGINSGKDLPQDMLEAIYRSIKGEPFKFPDETYDDLMYTFFSPKHEGWLEKQVFEAFMLNNLLIQKIRVGSGESGRGVGLFSTIGASTTSRTGASFSLLATRTFHKHPLLGQE